MRLTPRGGYENRQFLGQKCVRWTALRALSAHDHPHVGATRKVARQRKPVRTIVSVSQQEVQEGLPVHQVACGQQFVQRLQSGHEGLALLREGRFLLGGAYALLLAEGAPAPWIALPHGAGIVVVCCGLSRTLHAVGVHLQEGIKGSMSCIASLAGTVFSSSVKRGSSRYWTCVIILRTRVRLEPYTVAPLVLMAMQPWWYSWIVDPSSVTVNLRSAGGTVNPSVHSGKVGLTFCLTVSTGKKWSK